MIPDSFRLDQRSLGRSSRAGQPCRFMRVYIFKGGKFKELKIIFFFNSRESRALDKTIHVALKNLFYSLHIYCVEVGSKTADMKFLTKDQKSFYSENGYIKLENILTNDEIHHMSKEYDDIFQVGT